MRTNTTQHNKTKHGDRAATDGRERAAMSDQGRDGGVDNAMEATQWEWQWQWERVV